MSEKTPMSDDELWANSASAGSLSPADLGIDSSTMSSNIAALNEGMTVLTHSLHPTPKSKDQQNDK